MLGSVATMSGLAQANTQTPQDRSDPSVVEQELRKRGDARGKQAVDPLRVDMESLDSALTRPVLIRSIRLEGASALPASAYAPAILPYKNRTVSGAELQDLATAIAQVARNAGYGLASAWVPEQTVENGLLRVEIDEGRIDDIRIEGDAMAAVRPIFDGLPLGAPIPTADLERRLLLAGDLPGVDIDKPRIERIDGRTLLILRTSRDPVRGRASVDNWGSSTVGPVRAQLRVDVNGLFAEDDRLTIGGVVTPLDPKEFALARIAYAKAVGGNGTEITASAYAARSRPGGILSDREFEGQSLEGSIALSHPFIRSRAGSLWGETEFTVRDSEQSLADVVVRKDRLSILKAGLFSSAELGGGTARARLTASRGLGIFDATREGDLLTSRADGSAIFSKFEFWGHYDRSLIGPVSFQLQGEGQIASRPLLSSEEMGLGGRYFLRGYDYREFSGDKGVAGSIELRFDLPRLGRLVRDAQLYGYADAGTVGNYGDGSGGGSLASAGGGIRTGLGRNIDASLEVGVPLKEGADRDEELNPRISFVIGSRFE
ncbi:ShlB/FhaC/HecB family hemolysin secretion/activation protein [Allosphingosinicella sp.]|jgi:hemolysin activation/secretion protein|uniref:ShlB/FhaC/HecB family hemolysin secretion/activation protein n=1 Tax=Allosphingosinicella sp. TaxID=2823234 RepID=UPI003D73BEB8